MKSLALFAILASTTALIIILVLNIDSKSEMQFNKGRQEGFEAAIRYAHEHRMIEAPEKFQNLTNISNCMFVKLVFPDPNLNIGSSDHVFISHCTFIGEGIKSWISANDEIRSKFTNTNTP